MGTQQTLCYAVQFATYYQKGEGWDGVKYCFWARTFLQRQASSACSGNPLPNYSAPVSDSLANVRSFKALLLNIACCSLAVAIPLLAIASSEDTQELNIEFQYNKITSHSSVAARNKERTTLFAHMLQFSQILPTQPHQFRG